MRKITLIFFSFIFFIFYGCSKPQTDIKTISFSTWGSQSEINTIKTLIKEFEQENKNIKIKLIHIPDNYFQKLHLLIASNLAPDVIFINNLNAQIYIKANKFENLNKYLEKSKELSKENFIENSLIPLSHNNNIYAIPRDISTLVVYYNKDLFEKYLKNLPNVNWTQEEFLAIAHNLTQDINNDGKTDIFGFGFENNSLYWLPFLLSNGGGILSENSNKIILDTQNSKSALQFYSDLRNKYHVAPKADEQSSLTTSQLFMQGRVAMHLCGRWCSLTYKKNKNLNWDILPFPQGKNGSIIAMDTSGWAISSSSQFKEEAWKFIEFMNSNKAMEYMTKDGLIIPSNKNVAYSQTFLQAPPQNAKIFLTTINTAISTPICERYTEINDILAENLELLFNGKSDIDDIINTELISTLNKLLNKKGNQ